MKRFKERSVLILKTERIGLLIKPSIILERAVINAFIVRLYLWNKPRVNDLEKCNISCLRARLPQMWKTSNLNSEALSLGAKQIIASYLDGCSKENIYRYS